MKTKFCRTRKPIVASTARTNRNTLATRVTLREAGKRQADRAQVKDIVARYWDENADQSFASIVHLVWVEVHAARKRLGLARVAEEEKAEAARALAALKAAKAAAKGKP